MPEFSGVDHEHTAPERRDPVQVLDGEPEVAENAVMAVPGLLDGLTPLRRNAVDDALGGADVPGTVAQELRRRQGGGEALPGEFAGRMGEHFGMDLSAVRVHADQGAGTLARSIDAAAFTHGNDIYFAPGAYRPGSPDGQRVLAHELSHVAAQRSGADRGGSGSLTIGKANDPAEAAADRSADRAMTALRRTPSGAAGASAPERSAAGSDLGEAAGLEIRRWKWPWQSKSKSKDKDGKGKGAKSGTSSSPPTAPPTAPKITEDVKDTAPVTSGSVTGSGSSQPPSYPPPPVPTTVVEDTKDTVPSAPPQPTVESTSPPPQPTVVEDTKDTVPTAPPQPTVVQGTQPTVTEDTKDTGTGTQPTVETPTVTYPRVFTIGKEQVQVNSAEEEAEADQIMSDLKDKYGINLSSAASIKAIKKDYDDVPKKVTSKLKVSVWSMQELRALQEAAGYYAVILGGERKTSTLKGMVQGVTTIGKAKNGIDQGGAKGKLDTTTVGEYFSDSKNLALFDAGTNYIDKDYKRDGQVSDVQTSLSATAVHEMAHALVEPMELANWVSTLDYWADEDTKSGKKGAEAPPSNYGKDSAAEDLCESVSMYFINRPQLKKLCPGRDAFVDKVVKAWKPPEVDKALETAAQSPGSETPPSESESKD
jgi:hypothetical protein